MKSPVNPELSKSEREQMIHQIDTLAKQYQKENGRKPVIMEVCGSHTVALAQTGLKTRLDHAIRFISGPGCPVCVTDQSAIDQMISLVDQPGVILTTFGDMMRVPGSYATLMEKKQRGADIRIFYSPTEAVTIAENNPGQTVILLGIGFETTIPAILAAVREAEEKSVKNLQVYLSLKRIEPILSTLLNDPDLVVDGFILPGHVAMIVGERHFNFLNNRSIPGVISGFTLDEMLTSLKQYLDMLTAGTPGVINNYQAVVTAEGNPVARQWISEMLTPVKEAWRGLGEIPESGYAFTDRFSHFRVSSDLLTQTPHRVKKTGCRCGDVLTGKIQPLECALFDRICTPDNPVGPCMVSHEGSCSAAYEMKETIV
ncbi:[NiFe] hydrogenase metallocenter assembly protein HypD [Salisediminibacterium beveridgei]|uniref:[NiFe] hydrogenase metallocenter assembly protein HypD n=2 Tax=Salisediminibacterium beveridgei TaxID=632773 RepID=A0A1D7QXD6_9BACI|nr:[NiFe] hydrogenase metallocenter assembly protein HypD [Salisediminibacterium beveridgei]